MMKWNKERLREATVSKRKYLLDSLFDLKDTPKDTSTEDKGTKGKVLRKFEHLIN